MRTGTLTRPKEIAPVQSERATIPGYPLGEGAKTPVVFDERASAVIRVSTPGRTSFQASPPNGGLGSRPPIRRPRHVYGRGISLWKMWKSAAFATVFSG